jgi:diguanylate cyclase (GGDEF)-like protein
LLHGRHIDGPLLEGAAEILGRPLADLQDVGLAAFPTATTAPGGGSLTREIARLEREARQDELTGLLNRRYWSIAAREKLAKAPGDASVLICDVDNFKRVNDFQGHQVGDFVLTEVGRILDAHGVAGRLGGDEFAVCVCWPQDGETAARKILEAIADAFDGDMLRVSISIGVAERADAGDDLAGLLRRADAALYEAKRGGRGTFRTSSPEL